MRAHSQPGRASYVAQSFDLVALGAGWHSFIRRAASAFDGDGADFLLTSSCFRGRRSSSNNNNKQRPGYRVRRFARSAPPSTWCHFVVIVKSPTATTRSRRCGNSSAASGAIQLADNNNKRRWRPERPSAQAAAECNPKHWRPAVGRAARRARPTDRVRAIAGAVCWRANNVQCCRQDARSGFVPHSKRRTSVERRCSQTAELMAAAQWRPLAVSMTQARAASISGRPSARWAPVRLCVTAALSSLAEIRSLADQWRRRHESAGPMTAPTHAVNSAEVDERAKRRSERQLRSTADDGKSISGLNLSAVDVARQVPEAPPSDVVQGRELAAPSCERALQCHTRTPPLGVDSNTCELSSRRPQSH